MPGGIVPCSCCLSLFDDGLRFRPDHLSGNIEHPHPCIVPGPGRHSITRWPSVFALPQVLSIAQAIGETQPAVRECEAFLRQYKPSWDHNISATYLQQNIALALAARTLSSWAADIPWPVFLNDVMPYAR